MIFTKDISEWRVKVVGNQSCVRLGNLWWTVVIPMVAECPGAGSIEVATQCSDRVSSLVEYERRLNSWYGEGPYDFYWDRLRWERYINRTGKLDES